MASRDRSSGARLDSGDFCVLQVQLSSKGTVTRSNPQMHFVTVDNRMETLNFVQDNLDLCARNILKFVKVEDDK